MNRRGYSLRKVRKTKPLKKIPETNEIFDNIQTAHQRAATDQSILRISIDDKAKVKLTKEEFASISKRLQRSPSLGKWSVVITPQALPMT